MIRSKDEIFVQSFNNHTRLWTEEEVRKKLGLFSADYAYIEGISTLLKQRKHLSERSLATDLRIGRQTGRTTNILISVILTILNTDRRVIFYAYSPENEKRIVTLGRKWLKELGYSQPTKLMGKTEWEKKCTKLLETEESPQVALDHLLKGEM